MSRPRAIPDPTPGAGGGRRRRDRRGRGLRGQLLPRTVPAWRSRADRFDDLILDAVEHLEPRWGRELADVEFAVEDVPPSDPSPWEHGEVPLGRFFPADGSLPPRIVVYRRPVETRAADAHDIGALAQSVVVEQVAHLLNLSPEEVDPRYKDE
ncbi:metallopeptidase family protein [Kineosporia succinea]|uniref:Zn-dependent protease with MMP-like domain n=1 Tax=Kineosporia succinea TaxID=84632 RepID=A0ABT9NZ39_9ACTN|nr:metallopeptidase family protein [Kineosporia succinea]MDP9825404.1 putative Zn-dependent protease with MMP-like domain [Kineosporia succinea]